MKTVCRSTRCNNEAPTHCDGWCHGVLPDGSPLLPRDENECQACDPEGMCTAMQGCVAMSNPAPGENEMAELGPELAKAIAQTALKFLATFDGEDFGVLREDKPGPHDRRHLAIALDYVQELSAMVLNLADRVPPNVELTGSGAATVVKKNAAVPLSG